MTNNFVLVLSAIFLLTAGAIFVRVGIIYVMALVNIILDLVHGE